MPTEMHWAGTCRGQIVEYALAEMESKAVAINVTAKVEDYWDLGDQAWKDCRSHDFTVEGALWVIKKDGSLNALQIEALIQHAGWDGDLTSISQQTWKAKPCGFTVNEDTYRGDSRYRIAWLNDYERSPTGGNVSADKAQELQNRYGSQLRAVAGTVAQNSAAAPAGGPAPVAAPGPSLQEEADAIEPTDSDIPF